MAEYYPLLAKAVGSLPNSTSDTRRVVYERARKALIGQLRTLHPPVPDEDIEHESVELDRAIERLEAELASGPPVAVPPVAVPPAALAPRPAQPSPPAPMRPPGAPAPATVSPPRPAARPSPRMPASVDGGLGPAEKAIPALRTKLPAAKPLQPIGASATSVPAARAPGAVVPAEAETAGPSATLAPPPAEDIRSPRVDNGGTTRLEAQRPIAPMPPMPKGPKRRMWIIPVGIFVVALVAVAAWKLRDRPQTVARVKPTEQTQGDQGKIAERIGGPAETSTTTSPPAAPLPPTAPTTPPETSAQSATPAAAPAEPPATNPDLPVAHRAALLVEAPEETNKVKTYLGNVVWKLNTVNEGPNDSASLAVEADVDLPDDKMKAVVTFEKNTDPSLPASHTIKIRFSILPGSTTGDVKQISVPQVRNEDSPSGEALAGVTVPVIQNSFLVGLSPGNAETSNLQLLSSLQWIDVPMLLTSGKIAKLTFEKSDSGQRDLNEAITAWRKS